MENRQDIEQLDADIDRALRDPPQNRVLAEALIMTKLLLGAYQLFYPPRGAWSRAIFRAVFVSSGDNFSFGDVFGKFKVMVEKGGKFTQSVVLLCRWL